jgi:uncharacterized membrane protein YqiK
MTSNHHPGNDPDLFFIFVVVLLAVFAAVFLFFLQGGLPL